ncbi:hypothetical protein J3U11_09810 [Gilliamella sp. B2840]|nr:hypothetical protein [Gilliamella sp. B2894]MCX8665822.1 hypothetical protein [Gilliamella sp. B2887]MCX8693822.1 hypothetical protein [Gilliamella sp. B2881]MCX8696988.1 hypothetical protein [Gilliamella sp. B2828]MCX8698094.1 hypothetical protein [Gilliamella sp. B3000]MCX8701367.1 hypothetical protein [Gilliamella sp. B2840]
MLQPVEMVKAVIELGQLVPLLPKYPIPTHPMHVLYAADRRIPPKLGSFIDFCLQKFGQV